VPSVSNQLLRFAVIVLLGGRLGLDLCRTGWKTVVTDFPNYYVYAWAFDPGDNLSQLYDGCGSNKNTGQRRAAGCAVQLLSSHEHQLQILPSHIRATLFQ
jgi:hypothetical protein